MEEIEAEPAVATVDLEVGGCVEEPASTTSKSTNADNHNNEDDEEQHEFVAKERRIVQFIAPGNLPSGYRVEVTDGQDVFFVKVGKQVHKGEKCEATEVFLVPVMDRWADGIGNLSPNYEGSFCCLAMFCPDIANAAILESIGRDCFGRPTSGKIAVLASILLVFLSLFLSKDASFPFRQLFSAFFIFMATITRYSIRKKYKIPGRIWSDCFWGTFCRCCSATHMFRHMKQSGDEPKCCKKNPIGSKVV